MEDRVIIHSVTRINENSVPFNKNLLPHSLEFILKCSKVKSYDISPSSINSKEAFVCLDRSKESKPIESCFSLSIQSVYMQSQFKYNNSIRAGETAPWKLANKQFIGGAITENVSDLYTAAIIMVNQLGGIHPTI